MAQPEPIDPLEILIRKHDAKEITDETMKQTVLYGIRVQKYTDLCFTVIRKDPKKWSFVVPALKDLVKGMGIYLVKSYNDDTYVSADMYVHRFDTIVRKLTDEEYLLTITGDSVVVIDGKDVKLWSSPHHKCVSSVLKVCDLAMSKI
jgi:hypothetical protein